MFLPCVENTEISKGCGFYTDPGKNSFGFPGWDFRGFCLYDMIRYDMICYDTIQYDVILTPMEHSSHPLFSVQVTSSLDQVSQFPERIQQQQMSVIYISKSPGATWCVVYVTTITDGERNEVVKNSWL